MESYHRPIREGHDCLYNSFICCQALADVQSAYYSFKMAKTKELSKDMCNKIIELHKGQGYRKISKEMDLPLSTVGNIRRYKKFGDGISSIPRTSRPRKLNQSNSR